MVEYAVNLCLQSLLDEQLGLWLALWQEGALEVDSNIHLLYGNLSYAFFVQLPSILCEALELADNHQQLANCSAGQLVS